jgi:hypothetical protein
MPLLDNLLLSLEDTVNMLEPSDLPPHTLGVPHEALFFKLKLEINGSGKKIELKYSNAARLPTAGETDRAALLDRFFSQPNPWRRCQHNGSPHKSPLTIFNDQLRYIFIILDDQSWQFSSKHVPFMVDKNHASTYLSARRYVKNFAGLFGEVGVEDLQHGCIVAGFIANNQIGGGAAYSHAFNIYLDLLLTDWQNNTIPLPIVIDPDVGHPGGNGPP